MSRSQKIEHSRTARTLLAIVIVTLAILAVIICGQFWIERKISKMLEKEPISLGGKAYITAIGSIRVDLTLRSIYLTEVKIRTSPTQNTQDGPAAQLDLQIPAIKAYGIRYRKKHNSRPAAIYAQKLEITSPSITFNGIPGSDTKEKESSKGSNDVSVTIKKFIISNGNARISRWEREQKVSYAIAGLDINISDIRIGHNNQSAQATKMLSRLKPKKTGNSYFSTLDVAVDSLAYTFKNGALTLSATSLALDSESGNMSASRIAILPQYPKQQYTQRVGDHSDWTHVDISDINLSGVRLPADKDHGVLFADNMSVSSVLIESYKNRNQTQSHKVKPMLYQSIQDIPIGINIPTLEVTSFNLKYEEVAKGELQPGLITIDNMAVAVTGLTNRPTATSQYFVMKGNGTLLGAAPMNATLTLPVSKETDHFTAAIKLGEMPVVIINQVTEPMANIRMTKGKIYSAEINITGNSTIAQSDVTLRYNDLQVAIQRKRDPERERELLTFIANDIMIRRNNPERGKTRNGHGEFERDPHKSFWNFIWKTSFVGIKDIVLM